MPWNHSLPKYQRSHPNYDRYFVSFLGSFGEESSRVCFLDIGANVGDSAAVILSAIPSAQITCVEGSEKFLPYLRHNMRNFGNVEIVAAMAVPDGQVGRVKIRNTGSTAKIVPSEKKSVGEVPVISMAELLECFRSKIEPESLCILKSDTDGLDAALLASEAETVLDHFDVVWFEVGLEELDSGVYSLKALLANEKASAFALQIFDNLGNLMVSLPQVDASIPSQLLRWLKKDDSRRFRDFRYFDVWLVRSQKLEPSKLALLGN